MAILTNKPVNPSRDICTALDLAPFFFQNYGGNSFHTKKPDPHGLRTLIDEASALTGIPITPAETIMIGDSDVDILTARNCGARSIGCTFGFAPHTLPPAQPNHLADSPTDWLRILGIS
jgi:phosphoglycolate phosphatase